MSALLRSTLVLLIVMLIIPAAQAAPVPSRSDADTRVEVKLGSLDEGARAASVEDVTAELFANDEIARVLEEQGLSSDEVQTRLAQLSPQDLQYLSSNLDQVQAAGTVPDYIWILLAILLGLLILGAIF